MNEKETRDSFKIDENLKANNIVEIPQFADDNVQNNFNSQEIDIKEVKMEVEYDTKNESENVEIHTMNENAEIKEDDPNWVLKCLCDKTTENNDDSDLICCDMCNAWQHMYCYQIEQNQVPNKHFCADCSSDKTQTFEILKRNYHLNLEKKNLLFRDQREENSKETFFVNKNDCQCHLKIVNLLNRDREDGEIYDGFIKTKTCQTSNLKNGQKILKCIRRVPASRYLCEVKGDIHIFDECKFIQDNYNIMSSFIYDIDINGKSVVLDARTTSHISRYVRRSCRPNCQFSSITSVDSLNAIKIYLHSTISIEPNQEITVPIDRSELTLSNIKNNTRTHWQKYDYSSSLICVCGNKKSNTSEFPCPVFNLKKMFANSKKNKSPKNSPESSEVDSVKAVTPEQAPANYGVSREQKKVNYWLKVIKEMEGDNFTPKSLPLKRSRKFRSKNSDQNNIENGSNHQKETLESHLKSNFMTSNAVMSEKSAERTTNHTSPTSWLIDEGLTNIIRKHEEILQISRDIIEPPLYQPCLVPVDIALRMGWYHMIPHYEESICKIYGTAYIPDHDEETNQTLPPPTSYDNLPSLASVQPNIKLEHNDQIPIPLLRPKPNMPSIPK